MVELSPHPRKCEVCRTGRAFYCLRRRNSEQWLCEECYQASRKAAAEGEKGGEAR